MKRKYVPIVKCKKGEQKALLKLSDSVKESVIPLIEIPLFTKAMIKRNVTVESLINSFWENRKFFFYFMPDWYEGYDDFNKFVRENIEPLCSNYAIPVIDLSLVEMIEDWRILAKNDIAIRLRNNEFGFIEDVLNPLFNNTGLKRNQVHLIFDLQYVGENDLFAKISVLKAAFSDLDNSSEFASIIISCVSFPKPLPPMDSKKIYRFKRVETELFITALKLSKRFGFNYVYSDYGPSDIEENVFIIGMSPNFKIKYTAIDEYLYIKGIQIKRGGLDIENVRELAQILTTCADYCGEDYSWGDKSIYDIANGITSATGNLTTWVSYSLNHHITFITKQL